MQNFFLLLVLVVIGATLAQDDLSDIFRSDDHLAEPVLPNPVFADNLEWENSQSPNSDLIDWDTANGDTLLPQDNTNIIAGSDDSRLSLSHEDEPDAAFLSAAGCPSPKTLNQREERSICPSSELTVPHVPTMDDLTNEILYSTDEHGQESPSGVYIFNDRRAKDENYCPPYRPFFLCCYCNARLDWQYCQDCLPMVSVSGCFAPLMAVCCQIFGVYRPFLSRLTNLDFLIMSYPQDFDPNFNVQDGTLAELCSDRVFVNTPP